LLRQWQAGDKAALDAVMAEVHDELRRLARLHMRGEARVLTLQPTALVNEVYLRIAPLGAMDWRDRAHFFAMASRVFGAVLTHFTSQPDANVFPGKPGTASPTLPSPCPRCAGSALTLTVISTYLPLPVLWHSVTLGPSS
jgi:hypothetical protein